MKASFHFSDPIFLSNWQATERGELLSSPVTRALFLFLRSRARNPTRSDAKKFIFFAQPANVVSSCHFKAAIAREFSIRN